MKHDFKLDYLVLELDWGSSRKSVISKIKNTWLLPSRARALHFIGTEHRLPLLLAVQTQNNHLHCGQHVRDRGEIKAIDTLVYLGATEVTEMRTTLQRFIKQEYVRLMGALGGPLRLPAA